MIYFICIALLIWALKEREEKKECEGRSQAAVELRLTVTFLRELGFNEWADELETDEGEWPT